MKRSKLENNYFFVEQLFENVLFLIASPFFFFTFIRRVRITSSGGEVGRLNTGGGAEVNSLLVLSILIHMVLFHNKLVPKRKRKGQLVHISDASSNTLVFGTRSLHC